MVWGLCVTLDLREDSLTRLFFDDSSSDVLVGLVATLLVGLSTVLGSMFLGLVVRVFFVRNSRRLGPCRRSRGLIGIGSGGTWISDTAGRRLGGLCSLHDPWRIVSKYKRGRRREIVAETIVGWTQFQIGVQSFASVSPLTRKSIGSRSLSTIAQTRE